MPLAEYFNEVQKAQMPPRTKGFLVRLSDKQRTDSFLMQEQYLSQARVEQLGKGLQMTTIFQKVNLSDTGLTDSKWQSLLRNSNLMAVRELDLSRNPGLKQTGIEYLACKLLGELHPNESPTDPCP